MTVTTVLGRYRIMANVVGVMLIFVFLFAHVGHASIVGFRTSENVEDVIGPIHGALYVVYCLTVLQVWRQYHLRLWTLAAMVSAGWVPFVAFVAERWVTRHVAATTVAVG
jgi:integral membrane protein